MVDCVGVSTEMPVDQRGKHKSPPGSCQPWVNMLPCVNTPGAVADTGEVLIRAVEGALTSWGHPAPRGCVCIVSHSTVGSFYSCIRSFIHPTCSRCFLHIKLFGGTRIEQWARRQSLPQWGSLNRQTNTFQILLSAAKNHRER